MRERSTYIDAVRGLAIILVMLGHCIVLNGLEDGIVYDGIKAVQMPLFMAVSGYVTGKNVRIGSWKEMERKIGRRAVSYLVPFFVWILLLHPFDMGASVFRVLFQLDKGLWFLMVLFLLTMVMYPAIYLRQNKSWGRAGFWIIWLLFSGGLLLQYRSGSSFLSPHLTIYHLPFYMGGYLTALYREGRGGSVQNFGRGRRPGAVIALALFVVLIVRYDMVTAGGTWELLCQMAAGALGCFLCVVLVAFLGKGRIGSALACLGNYTLELYVLHFHFAAILGLGEKGLRLYSVAGIVWVTAAFLLMSLLTGICIVILKRFWITDFLLFGKGLK